MTGAVVSATPARSGAKGTGVSDSAGAADVRFARLEEMSAAALHDMLKLRFDVFVLEQRSLYPEIDGQDPSSLHLIAKDDHGATVGTLRILGLGGEGPVWIGRIAVAPSHRGDGLGSRMIDAAIAEIARRAPGRPIALGAQIHLEAFYCGFGFRRSSEIYDDGGIDHVDMILDPAGPGA